MIKKFFIIILFILISKVPIYSSSIGGIAASQQRYSVDAKLMSVSDSFDAFSSDVSSIYYNPAGLSFIRRVKAFASYIPVWDSLTHIFFIGVTIPTRYVPIGIGTLNIMTDGIKLRDDSPETIAISHYNNTIFLLSTSYTIFKGFYVGIRFNIIYQHILDYTKTSGGMDFAFMWRVNNPYEFTKSKLMRILQPVTIGFIFYNLIPPTFKFIQEEEKFPCMIRSAISYRSKRIKKILKIEYGIGIDLIPKYKSVILTTGIEMILWNIFYIRGGYKFSDKSITLGSGIDFNNISVNYGFHPLNISKNFYTFDIRIRF